MSTMTPEEVAVYRATSDDPTWQAHIDRDLWNAERQPVPPPCPAWCADRAAHRFDLAEIGSAIWTRQHSNDLTDHVTMVQTETYNSTTDVVTLDPRFMSLWVDGDRIDGEFTPESARGLIAAIGTGVRRFEEIIAGGVA